MIKEILSVFRSDSLMSRAYSRSFEMLELTRQMYMQSKKILRTTDEKLDSINIYKEDHAVNKFEREVRKDVFNHLLLSGNDQLPSGLTLVSIVIDIERIGDFTKNIVEIASEYGGKLHGGDKEETLLKIENAVDVYFEKTIECFRKADTELGLKLIEEYKWVTKTCDEFVMSMIKENHPNLKTSSAVALTLYVRSLKRIFSHLRNVTTSVVNPFHRIGFKPKYKESNN